jgi:two-component system LytT family sensor kinase
VDPLWATLHDWYVWAALAAVIYYVCRFIPMDGPRWPVGLVIHLTAAGLFGILHLALLGIVAGGPGPWAQRVQHLYDVRFHWNVVVYCAIAAFSHAVYYHRSAREKDRQLAEAELSALKMQLHPHFLFNTLETISALMHKDVDAADRVLVRLADLLRYTLRQSHRQQVPLEEELRFLERYLEIERTRFQDRLSVRFAIDSDTLRAAVPNLILQPLVENAIRHGIGPRAVAGQVEILSSLKDGMLSLEVRDNGAGAPIELAEGIGLANTRRRLAQLYGPGQLFRVGNADGGGFVASVVIPFEVAGA